jgi:hypothetical protein
MTGYHKSKLYLPMGRKILGYSAEVGHPSFLARIMLRISRTYYKGLSVAMSFLRYSPGHIIGFPGRMTSAATSVAPRITGTFCRMRWFARYARGEARLCRRPNPSLLER